MVERTYLQWVGTSYYSTIEDFMQEAVEKGICKKLPNVKVAMEIARRETIIFLAHDQGTSMPCKACSETVSCPVCAGKGIYYDDTCKKCKGLCYIERGTGGTALVDGETWAYVRLLRLKKNKQHDFWKSQHAIERVHFCQSCAGRGRIPLGLVFGFYSPNQIVFVESKGRKDSISKRIISCGVEVVKPNHGGRRLSVGSVYAISNRHHTFDADAVSKMVGPLKIFGNFGVLQEPIPYHDKHFRGIKRWMAPQYIEDKKEPGLFDGVV